MRLEAAEWSASLSNVTSTPPNPNHASMQMQRKPRSILRQYSAIAYLRQVKNMGCVRTWPTPMGNGWTPLATGVEMAQVIGAGAAPMRAAGIYWFANQVLVRYAGCNDMKRFEPRPDSNAEILHMRRVIKAFIDQQPPCARCRAKGGHFMVLIGYLDLDADGWPTKAILTDSSGTYLIAGSHFRLGELTPDSPEVVALEPSPRWSVRGGGVGDPTPCSGPTG